jgi:hypothetical protein
MAAIKVVDLQSSALPLFNTSDCFMEAISEPSDEELRTVFGGKSSKSKKKGSTNIIIVNNIAYYCSCDDPCAIYAPVTNVVVP